MQILHNTADHMNFDHAGMSESIDSFKQCRARYVLDLAMDLAKFNANGCCTRSVSGVKKKAKKVIRKQQSEGQ